MTTPIQEPLPAIFQHCLSVYKLMRDEATPTPIEGAKMMVWEGFLTKLICGDLELSVPYYSKVKNELMRMGCIRQLQRGGGNSPSRWELIRKPTDDLFRQSSARVSRKDVAQEATRQAIHDIGTRLDALEEAFQEFLTLYNANIPAQASTSQSHSTTHQQGVAQDDNAA